jgi:hypothetical protein
MTSGALVSSRLIPSASALLPPRHGGELRTALPGDVRILVQDQRGARYPPWRITAGKD